MENVQEIETDLFNLTSIFKKEKFISNSYNMIQNLCEIVVWHIFVNFVILISDSNETYRFTMRESNIVNMKGVFSNGKFIFKECLQSIS